LPRPFGPRNDECLTSVFYPLTSVFSAGIELFAGIGVGNSQEEKIKKYFKIYIDGMSIA